MLNNLEVVLITCVVIWGAVHLIKHFLPSSYERLEQNTYNPIADRLKAVEEKLNITTQE